MVVWQERLIRTMAGRRTQHRQLDCGLPIPKLSKDWAHQEMHRLLVLVGWVAVTSRDRINAAYSSSAPKLVPNFGSHWQLPSKIQHAYETHELRSNLI